MKTDINGCSTTAAGQEQYEEYYDRTLQARRVQYDYRTPGGRLFSCIAKSLTDARRKRGEWLKKNDDAQPDWVLEVGDYSGNYEIREQGSHSVMRDWLVDYYDSNPNGDYRIRPLPATTE